MLDDDEVSVMEQGRRISRFRELELESLGLATSTCGGSVGLLRSAGAVDAEPIPKVVRALGPAATGPPDAVPPEIGPDEPAGRGGRGALTEAVERIVQHDPGIAHGGRRIAPPGRGSASRRLRSDLRTFAPLLDQEWADALTPSCRAWRASSARYVTSTSSSIG